ncbi:MAG: hypothetical protein JEZ03_09025 [Bacteroidales bacterium]|nr:hypothetical protein [Bacteroidales bacterium]
MDAKKCESCGMLMKIVSDFGGENLNNKYCKHCTDKDGNLKSYEEKVNDFKGLLMRANDFGEEQAVEMAKESLKQFPAWSDQ